MHRLASRLIVSLALSGFCSTIAQAHDAKDPRHIAMTGLGDDMKAISAMVKAGAPVGMAEHEAAKRIAATAGRMPELFPKGSGGHHSRAKPEIWSDWVGFTAKVDEFELAASRLVRATADGDPDRVAGALTTTGATCSDCHKAYRKPKKH